MQPELPTPYLIFSSRAVDTTPCWAELDLPLSAQTPRCRIRQSSTCVYMPQRKPLHVYVQLHRWSLDHYHELKITLAFNNTTRQEVKVLGRQTDVLCSLSVVSGCAALTYCAQFQSWYLHMRKDHIRSEYQSRVHLTVCLSCKCHQKKSINNSGLWSTLIKQHQ